MKLDHQRYQVGICSKSENSVEWVLVISDIKHGAMVGGLDIQEAKEMHRLIGERIKSMEKYHKGSKP